MRWDRECGTRMNWQKSAVLESESGDEETKNLKKRNLIVQILEGEIFCKIGARQVSETIEIGCSREVDPGIMR